MKIAVELCRVGFVCCAVVLGKAQIGTYLSL